MALGKALAVTFLSHKLADDSRCAEAVHEGMVGLVCTCSFLWDPRLALGLGNVCSGDSLSFCSGVPNVFAGSTK